MKKLTIEELTNYSKRYGFIFQGSEIYGGLANTWDYGPLGSRLVNNLKDLWRIRFIQERLNAYEVDAGILMDPDVWKASGHLASFSDPLVDCKKCRERFRADNLIEDFGSDKHPDLMSQKEMEEFITTKKVPCPNCGTTNFTPIREFNLMFKTQRGVTNDSKSTIYLRPENAQGEYVNYLNVLRSMRETLPFSIGQVGKAFRNEITPKNFIFRTIEFEQMEFQTFVNPKDDEKYYEYFKKFAWDFLVYLGINPENLRYKDHEKLAHYAKAACDIEYNYPFGWGELNGTHNRTDFDLKKHQEYTKINMKYTEGEETFIPYIIESTIGVGRLVLAILNEAYEEEMLDDGTTREVMRFKPYVAPVKVVVLPLVKKYHEAKALEIAEEFSKEVMTRIDVSGSIGKRYRRADAIGVPFCVTIDDETINNETVTIRNRDTMKQITIPLKDAKDYIESEIRY